jgi:hypothetical protein
MNILEILMLICFGSAWPFSIYKSYRTKDSNGKSVLFMLAIFLGYMSGILNKVYNNFDSVIYLYMLNSAMVLAEIFLYFKNKGVRIRVEA